LIQALDKGTSHEGSHINRVDNIVAILDHLVLGYIAPDVGVTERRLKRGDRFRVGKSDCDLLFLLISNSFDEYVAFFQ
jgi:hypothetical protein